MSSAKIKFLELIRNREWTKPSEIRDIILDKGIDDAVITRLLNGHQSRYTNCAALSEDSATLKTASFMIKIKASDLFEHCALHVCARGDLIVITCNGLRPVTFLRKVGKLATLK